MFDHIGTNDDIWFKSDASLIDGWVLKVIREPASVWKEPLTDCDRFWSVDPDGANAISKKLLQFGPDATSYIDYGACLCFLCQPPCLAVDMVLKPTTSLDSLICPVFGGMAIVPSYRIGREIGIDAVTIV